MRPYLHRFDLYLTTLIQQWPEWVRGMMVGITSIGHPVCTIGIALIIVAFGWGKANLRLVSAGSMILIVFCISSLTKLLLHRERPATEYAATMRFETFSFPSGHTVGSTMAYGLLAYLAWQALPQPWNYIVTALLTGLIILVGVSRIYLGAHFPSDVVAGWMLGAIGLTIIIFVIRPSL